jgi:hypothetical protein
MASRKGKLPKGSKKKSSKKQADVKSSQCLASGGVGYGDVPSAHKQKSGDVDLMEWKKASEAESEL